MRNSLHLYSGFGARDRSDADKEYARAVYGPDLAEYSIEICRGLINKAVGAFSLALTDFAHVSHSATRRT
jgi:hypothetical protein